MRWYPMTASHFIYTLTDPRNGIVMYVGCTLNPVAREQQHRCSPRTKPVGRWMDELAAAGLEPIFTVVAAIRSRDRAWEREKRLIAEYRKLSHGLLLNRKPGRRGRFDSIPVEL
jgi:predicted GIY-YIG superfamily endonuclease